jgi:hypothetical protein
MFSSGIVPVVFWTVPAERSGGGAFARAGWEQTKYSPGTHESGAARRFPPQSKKHLE